MRWAALWTLRTSTPALCPGPQGTSSTQLLWGRKPQKFSSVRMIKRQNCWVGLGLSFLGSSVDPGREVKPRSVFRKTFPNSVCSLQFRLTACALCLCFRQSTLGEESGQAVCRSILSPAVLATEAFVHEGATCCYTNTKDLYVRALLTTAWSLLLLAPS